MYFLKTATKVQKDHYSYERRNPDNISTWTRTWHYNLLGVIFFQAWKMWELQGYGWFYQKVPESRWDLETCDRIRFSVSNHWEATAWTHKYKT